MNGGSSGPRNGCEESNGLAALWEASGDNVIYASLVDHAYVHCQWLLSAAMQLVADAIVLIM